MPAFLAPLIASITEAAFWVGLTKVLTNVLSWFAKQGPAIIGNILLAFGFYFLVAEPAGEFVLGYVQERFGLLQGTLAETFLYINADKYLTLVITAYAQRAAGNVALKSVRGRPRTS